MLKYYCEICNHESEQKSHHQSHLKTDKHNDKQKIFELELKNLTDDELIENYDTIDIENIIKTKSIIKIKNNTTTENIIEISDNIPNNTTTENIIEISDDIPNNTTISNNEIEPNKYTIIGDIIWRLEDNLELNLNYNDIQTNLTNIVKKCHDILYSGSIVGIKAQNDIMKIICVKILEYYFKNNNNIQLKCEEIKTEIPDNQYNSFMIYSNNLIEITKKDNVFKEWKFFVNNFLCKLYPDIFFHDQDDKFNCVNETIIKTLIKSICKINVDKSFIDAFSTTCGDIHELFRKYNNGKCSKELGQYFTPRHLIHAIFHGLQLETLLDKNNTELSIYDPCMGTAGFLTRLYSLYDIKPHNIYGCEFEIDSIKFGKVSLILSTNNLEHNILKCNSICNNNLLINNKKFDLIVTNPPFGTKINYETSKKDFIKYKGDCKNNINFEDIYPIKTNNGACLFIQHCVYMLNNNGICAIVLPYGEIFNSKSKTMVIMRKWLCDNVEIKYILKVADNCFEHTAISTAVLVFTKTGSTNNIQFLETNKECNLIKNLFTINTDDLVNNNYNLNYENYLCIYEEKYNCNIKTLRDVCEIQNGKRIVKNKTEHGEYPVLGGGGFTSFYTNNYTREDITCKISREGMSLSNCVMILNQKYYLNSQAFTIISNSNILLNKYLWNYLNCHKEYVFNCGRGTAQLAIDIEKFKNIKIPIPSLEIQQKIVDELSIIDTNIQTINLRINQLKYELNIYKEYYLIQEIKELLNGCEKKTLGEICKFLPKSKRQASYGNKEGTFPFFKSSLIINKYVDKPDYTTESIIIGDGGEPNINFGVKFSASDHCYIIQNNDPNIYNLKYIYYYLFNNLNIMENLYTGVAIKNISKTNLRSIKIPIPSLEIQQQCIELFEQKENFINNITDKINIEKNYINDLNNICKNIIYNYCN